MGSSYVSNIQPNIENIEIDSHGSGAYHAGKGDTP
jgi:hypothetical protein